MLSIYRRHRAKCKFAADRVSKKCRCTLWATGTLEGRPFRRSLKTRNFERAEQLKREIEDGNKPEQPKSTTIKNALSAYIKDAESRNLSKGTLKKYRRLQARVNAFVDRGNIAGLERLVGWTGERTRDFRADWKLSSQTAAKELGFLRAFFTYCISNGWITQNPAKAIKAPQVKTNARLPFSENEIQAILSKAKDDRELAFILILRHTGLRIGDASLLKISALQENRVYLYTTKAGTPVSILIPETLVSLLKNLPPKGGYFFLRGESTHPHTASDLWRKRIKAICKDLKIAPDHPHRFRHSLAADLLMRGASVEDVAAILGNSPAVVMKHYSQWIKGRQDRLDAFLEKTWKKPALVRVK